MKTTYPKKPKNTVAFLKVQKSYKLVHKNTTLEYNRLSKTFNSALHLTNMSRNCKKKKMKIKTTLETTGKSLQNIS